MLKEKQLPYRYREYTQDPLSEAEIREILGLLDLGPEDMLRRRDPAFKELNLRGDEPSGELVAHMARHPTLLQRPIGVLNEQAAVGRPVEKLLDLFDQS